VLECLTRQPCLYWSFERTLPELPEQKFSEPFTFTLFSTTQINCTAYQGITDTFSIINNT